MQLLPDHNATLSEEAAGPLRFRVIPMIPTHLTRNTSSKVVTFTAAVTPKSSASSLKSVFIPLEFSLHKLA